MAVHAAAILSLTAINPRSLAGLASRIKGRAANAKTPVCLEFRSGDPPPRVYMLDLPHTESLGAAKEGTTKQVIAELRNAFFKRHGRPSASDGAFTVTVYVRQGNLARWGIAFEYKVLRHLCKSLAGASAYRLNIVSAGTSTQMEQVRKQFGEFGAPHFLLNSPQEQAFATMVSSNVLVYNNSSFPFIASLYSDALVVGSKNNRYTSPLQLYPDNPFLGNYILIDETEPDYSGLDVAVAQLPLFAKY
tara:strand:+ start:455 stop:1195 length:741 start_codon:yes stop_codon:yes gene_type:complete